MDIDEKRMYGDERAQSTAHVATGQGLARVAVSGDQIGRFSFVRQEPARDVAADGERIVLAADDVYVAASGEPFDPTGFGAATAVAVADALVAASETGEVSRYRNGEWASIGEVEAVHAMDGDLVATSDGVYRVTEDALEYVGLDGATDVAAAGVPLAATEDGLYRLGNGWQRVLDGSFSVAAAATTRADGHARTDAHAATADSLYAYDDAMDGWQPCSLPIEEPVADVAYGECPYVVTRKGTFLVDADPEQTPDGAGGWRSRALGLPGVVAMAVR